MFVEVRFVPDVSQNVLKLKNLKYYMYININLTLAEG